MVGADGITYGPNVKLWESDISKLKKESARISSMKRLLVHTFNNIIQLNKIYNAKHNAKDSDAKEYSKKIDDVEDAFKNGFRFYFNEVFKDEILKSELPEKTKVGFFGKIFGFKKKTTKERMIEKFSEIFKIINAEKNKEIIPYDVRRIVKNMGNKLMIK